MAVLGNPLDMPVAQVYGAMRRAAISGSCVTITIVRPAPFSASSSSMISAPVAESRFPVGSSARMSCGLFTSARAMATRCCWPPESSAGR